jgi:hypothetical protein
MNTRTFLDALLQAERVEEVEETIAKYWEVRGKSLKEIPIGGRPNNRGAIEVAVDPARSAIERITNGQDALLELEHHRHAGVPKCQTPREAASAWLGVPDRDGLAGMSVKERQDLANQLVVRLEPGEGRQSRVLTVIDRGIGIHEEHMTDTILSLNESNKIQKHYLAGTYGQGGSSTFAFSKYSLIASRSYGSDRIAFTVVRYLDLPPEQYKTGHYVFLVEDGAVLSVDATTKDLPHGTIVRHFGYDLTNYANPIGPNSLYGALNRILFDPVAPVRFENKVHGWNRVIKGSRNALNGAVDQGDSRRPDLDYQLPMFKVSLGDYGEIGIEYWVLSRPSDEKRKKNPADAFVDSRKPIILTHNGQNQGELGATLVRKDADLPFLRNRLICHVNCDKLSAAAKRLLFSSTREQSRQGHVLARIQEELTGLLKADDELRRLNEEARESSLRDKDKSAEQQMKRQVAKLMRIAGAALQDVGGTAAKGQGSCKVITPGPRPKPTPIAPQEPPTFIRIVWEDDKDIPFYGGQRRYIRIETDANSDYHNPDNAAGSRINIAVGDDLRVFGTSPLRNGRMRAGIECNSAVIVGTKGSIRVELYRKGMSALSDEQDYVIVDPPAPKEQNKTATVPDFKVIPVSGPEDDDWDLICPDAEDNDISKHASGSAMNQGCLYIYYSTRFPRFAIELRRFEQQDPSLARSFQKRYELWLAVHSLLMQQDKDQDDEQNLPEHIVREMERQERCRLAVLATIVASQEIRTGVLTEDREAEAAE